MLKFDIKEIRKAIQELSKESKVYIGCDSERFKRKGVWYSRYVTVVVLHLDSKHGCKVFGKKDIERDFDPNKSKPVLRMMNEVYRASNLYLELEDLLEGRDVQIHLDINPDENYGSNVAYAQALGYVKGVCGLDAKTKPEAFASSKVADRYTGGKGE